MHVLMGRLIRFRLTRVSAGSRISSESQEIYCNVNVISNLAVPGTAYQI